MKSDWELMRSWASGRNETAFAELVGRHINLVYSSALRQVRDAELARDVAQAVFLVLSRKASSLKEGVLLAGWLVRTTSHIAARAVRADVRRKRRESEASIMQFVGGGGNESEVIEPEIDSALAALPAPDRDVLVIRFFEGHALRAVGERLGVSEEAAKKRVSRAIEKVRAILAKRGVEITSVALGSALLGLRSEAAPECLAGGISQSVASNATSPCVAALADAAPEMISGSGAILAIAALVALMLATGVALWGAHWEKTAVQTGVEQGPNEPAVATKPPPIVAKTAATPGKSLLVLAIRAAEDNKPIDADVLVACGNKREPDSSDDLHTDTDGVVSVPVLGDRIYWMHVWVSAPGRVPVSMSWKGHEFVAPILQHTVRLERGQTLEGLVQDEQGQPVEGARISFNSPGDDLGARENIAFRSANSVLSDGGGHFRSDQLPLPVGDHAIAYVVDHHDFVRQRIQLNGVESIRTNQLIVLKRGFKVRGRVVDEFGNPVPGAKVVEAHDYADPHKSTQADPGGEFELGPFPRGAVNVAARADGFQEHKQNVPDVENATNVVLKLLASSGEGTGRRSDWAEARTVRLFGRVVDSQTQQPVSSFTVLANQRYTAATLVGDGTNGQFDWPVDMSFSYDFSLIVRAEGYQPAETDNRHATPGGEEHFEVNLTPGADIVGQVLSPAGEPVTGAFVGLIGNGFAPTLLDGCRPYQGGVNGVETTTDANGRFRFKPTTGARAVLVAHEVGCIQATIARASKEPLVLVPWGSIEGRLMVGGRPLAGQGVTLMPTIQADSDEYASVNAQQNVTTDENGVFRFPKVPAGPITVSRYFNFNRNRTGTVGMNDYHDVEVPAGGVVRLDLGGEGRTVTGKLLLSQNISGYRWGDDLESLNQPVGNEPKLFGPPMDFRDPEWHKIVVRQERFRRSQHHYFLQIDPNGAFRIEDVVPGTYTLDITISDPPDPTKRDYENYNRKQRGKLTQTVMVGDENVDLGVISIPIE